ncbi:MAG: hypothetical protein HRU19_10920 [Pseudobacteriovorax sp.]|nr:hypothetical protein [Pseudobacteriovorax sp.]
MWTLAAVMAIEGLGNLKRFRQRHDELHSWRQSLMSDPGATRDRYCQTSKLSSTKILWRTNDSWQSICDGQPYYRVRRYWRIFTEVEFRAFSKRYTMLKLRVTVFQ